MTFKKVLSFFLTGATALSMTTAAFASDDTVIMLPADVASQAWYAPAVRYAARRTAHPFSSRRARFPVRRSRTRFTAPPAA